MTLLFSCHQVGLEDDDDQTGLLVHGERTGLGVWGEGGGGPKRGLSVVYNSFLEYRSPTETDDRSKFDRLQAAGRVN